MSNALPKYIYKYKTISDEKSFGYVIDIIKNNQIYLPCIDEINDPLEGSIIPMHLSVMGGAIPYAVGKNHPIINDIKREYRILSLTENAVSPQMWAHYGDNYRGICIGFRTDKTFKKIRKISYINKYTGEEPELNSREKIEKTLEEAYYYKAKDWKYEKEWRIFQKEEKFLKYEKDEIAFIIIGHMAEEQRKKELYNLAEKNDISVYETYIADAKFKVNILEYNKEIEYSGVPLKYVKLNRIAYK